MSYDGNGDGNVSAADLIGLLAEFGSECLPDTTFDCGETLEYQGYDYATVLVGEQCWFAENLRVESEGLLWYYRDSNLGHTDFQSVALPTEL